MTKIPVERRCRWCGRRFAVRPGRGRPREFCRPACRQQDYLARSRAREAGLSERELVVARAELDTLYDQLYVLECAVEDVDRDLAGTVTARDLREAVDWLLDAARPLTGQRLGPEPAPG